MNDTPHKARRTLPSSLSQDNGNMPPPDAFKAAQRLTAPLGIVSDHKVKEPSFNFTIRIRDTTRTRIKEYAYIHRLSLDEALVQLLNIAEK